MNRLRRAAVTACILSWASRLPAAKASISIRSPAFSIPRSRCRASARRCFPRACLALTQGVPPELQRGRQNAAAEPTRFGRGNQQAAAEPEKPAKPKAKPKPRKKVAAAPQQQQSTAAAPAAAAPPAGSPLAVLAACRASRAGARRRAMAIGAADRDILPLVYKRRTGTAYRSRLFSQQAAVFWPAGCRHELHRRHRRPAECRQVDPVQPPGRPAARAGR